MLPSAIRDEVRCIAEIAERFHQGEMPLGFGEMPCTVNLALGIAVCRVAGIEENVNPLKGLAYLAFQMGRQFGKMEARRGLGEIADAVLMVQTDWPSGLYNMYVCLAGEDDVS